MPIPAAAIPALTSAGGGLLQGASNLFSNYQSQQFQKQMYGRQYNDNIKFWQMQNEYNAPPGS